MKKEELEQYVKKLEEINDELYRRINQLEKTNHELNSVVKFKQEMLEKCHYENERNLTKIIYGLITKTNTEIETMKTNHNFFNN